MRQPGYWMNEMSGRLAPAVWTWLTFPGEITADDLALLRAYVIQWIDSPVWDPNPFADEQSRLILDMLRTNAHRIASGEDLANWVKLAVEFCVDPF